MLKWIFLDKSMLLIATENNVDSFLISYGIYQVSIVGLF